jgi:hypothetical protein
MLLGPATATAATFGAMGSAEIDGLATAAIACVASLAAIAVPLLVLGWTRAARTYDEANQALVALGLYCFSLAAIAPSTFMILVDVAAGLGLVVDAVRRKVARERWMARTP